MHMLSEAVKTVRHNGAAAAGTTDVDPSNGVDTAGFQAVQFEVAFGAITAGAVTSIKAQQSSDDGDSDAYSDIAGTSITVADDDDGKVFILDIRNPTKRYVKCYVDRGTQNAVLEGITAHLYDPTESLPITQDSTVGGVERHVTPAEGTA